MRIDWFKNIAPHSQPIRLLLACGRFPADGTGSLSVMTGLFDSSRLL